MEEEGRSLSRLPGERDSRLQSGPKSSIWAQPEEEGGFVGVLKWIQNKPQASPDSLSIESLDPTPSEKEKGHRGLWLGREAPAQAAEEGHGAWSLGSNGSDSPRAPNRLLPSGC